MVIAKAVQVMHLASTLSVLSLALFAYERSVEPLYGSTPTGFYLPHFILASIALAFSAPVLSVQTSQFIFGISLCAVPITAHRVAVLTGRHGDATWGPIITHLLVLAPIFYSGSSIHRNTRIVSSIPRIIEPAVKSQLLYWVPWLLVRNYLSASPHLLEIPNDSLLLALSASSLILPRIMNISAPQLSGEGQVNSKTALFNALSILAGVLVMTVGSPVLEHPLTEVFNHPTYPLRILSSVQSTTGLIVVGEALPPSAGQEESLISSVRYLRASHSLLGGVWIGRKAVTMDGAPHPTDSEGTPLGDSIYAAFVLQEAARLVDSTGMNKESDWENALIIGLGAGISASAFQRHNISTTIIEIDPAVYAAARQYFGLADPGPEKVFLEDARGWVAQRRAAIDSSSTDFDKKPELYDIVVHDCFSGGGVPKHIFTLEFWEDLKAIVSPQGVVAVNFAGHLGSNASRAILLTLLKSFGQCRAFQDSGEHSEDQPNAFINMVFFCTPSPKTLTFRAAEESDYLGSYLREHVLSDLPKREVDLKYVTGDMSAVAEGKQDQWILTDLRNPLGDWQKDQGMEHWKVMRDVLPDIFWETY